MWYACARARVAAALCGAVPYRPCPCCACVAAAVAVASGACGAVRCGACLRARVRSGVRACGACPRPRPCPRLWLRSAGLSFERIRDALLSLDEGVLTLDRLAVLAKVIPTQDELDVASAYDGTGRDGTARERRARKRRGRGG